MADLFVEVDEALKQERLEKLWKNYGGLFLGLLAVLILGTGANSGYKHWQKSKKIKQTNLYMEAVSNKGSQKLQIDSLLLIRDDLSPALASLAALQAAGIALETDDPQTSTGLFKELAKDNASDKTARDLAKLMLIKHGNETTLDEKLEQLKILYEDTSNPWRYEARLEAALINAHSVHDFKTARLHLKEILDTPAIPETLKKKSQSLDILYALKDETK